jgi:hypothetical protein
MHALIFGQLYGTETFGAAKEKCRSHSSHQGPEGMRAESNCFFDVYFGIVSGSETHSSTILTGGKPLC